MKNVTDRQLLLYINHHYHYCHHRHHHPPGCGYWVGVLGTPRGLPVALIDHRAELNQPSLPDSHSAQKVFVIIIVVTVIIIVITIFVIIPKEGKSCQKMPKEAQSCQK